jgi:hypothetical protein
MLGRTLLNFLLHVEMGMKEVSEERRKKGQ